MTETLFCLASQHVDSLGLSEGFTSLSTDSIQKMFEPTQIWFGPRSLLETNEHFRQLVSYVVMRHGDRVLTYRRTAKGGESRLHGRLSLGVGGHWNVSDVVSEDGAIDAMASLERACARELAEEIDCSTPERTRMVGVIKESGNAVSRVHLGVVIECWLGDMNVRLRDEGLCDAQFLLPTELARHIDEMETWSSCLVPHLSA
jgi:predicted NUDIX family phosphoesterase